MTSNYSFYVLFYGQGGENRLFKTEKISPGYDEKMAFLTRIVLYLITAFPLFHTATGISYVLHCGLMKPIFKVNFGNDFIIFSECRQIMDIHVSQI